MTRSSPINNGGRTRMLIALVRHGSAGRRGSGPGDRNRPLDATGHAQADALVTVLGSVPLSRILSSPYPRCRQTVEPLAAARGIGIEDLELLAEGHAAGEVIAYLSALEVDGAALCSHGDVIGGVVSTLERSGLIEPGRARWAKGSTWLLSVESGRITGARYLAPEAGGG